ncbi:Triosephosphate isomerase [Buchnera aphidicola (Periphyllus testudinaceus)]|uniref:triose-phosphate isomerase n=1 Tax=Buchnera aphidicola TaxID=9 RepID=UPI003464CBEC
MIKPIIVANWKLYGNKTFVQEFSKYFNLNLKNYLKKNTIIIAPPIIYIEYMKKLINEKNIFFSSQNIDYHNEGAFTGEISSRMLNDIGVKYVILGHSERRKNHFESNKLIAKKFHSVKKNNLIPILCIGETKEEKKLELTEKILKKQIDEIFLKCGKFAFNKTIVAYEPIWAIGSGKTATPNLINKILKMIKKYIIKNSFNNIKLYMQYGGSVSPENIKNIINEKYVDGVLIGSGSLNFKNFKKIIQISSNFNKKKTSS